MRNLYIFPAKRCSLILVFFISSLFTCLSSRGQCFENFYVYQLYPYGQLCSPQTAAIRAEYYYTGSYVSGEFRWYTSDTDPFPVQTNYISWDFGEMTADYYVYATNGLTMWVSFYNYMTGCESYRMPYTFYISPMPYIIQDYARKCRYDPATVQLSSNVSGVTFQLYKLYEYYDPWYGWVQDYQYIDGNTTGYFEIWDFYPAEADKYYAKIYQPYGCATPYYYQIWFDITGAEAPAVSGNLSIPSGSSTTLTASGNAFNYKWYDGNGTYLADGWQYTTPSTLTPNTYTYQVRGSNSDGSCLSDPATVIVTVTPPIVTYTTLFSSSNFTKVIDVSKPVGTVNGTPGTTPSGGTSYNLPIYTAPGTNGLQPSVSITYNSQSGNGIAGMGWNISGLSVISRTGKNIYHNGIVGPTTFTNTDAFILDGMRLNAVSGTNGANGTIYAGEAEAYSKIISNTSTSPNNPDWFQVISKDGMTMEFGHTTDSRVLTDDGQNVMLWRLNKIIDISGNYVEFKYDNGFRDSRIDEINYTGNAVAGLQPYNKIKFNYGMRADGNTVYEAGASVSYKHLLTSITIKHDAELIKTYQFNYGSNNISSFLKEIVEAGTDGTSLNSTIFLYGDQPQNISSQPTFALTGPLDFYSGDFDADGKTDLLAGTFYYDQFGIKLHSKYDIRTNITSSPSLLYTRNLPSGDAVKVHDKKFYNFLTSDCNGDGRDDVISVNTGSQYTYPGSYKRVLNNITINYTGSAGYTQVQHSYPMDFFYYYNFIHDKGNYFIPADFDGDGNQDYILVLAKRRTEYEPDPFDYFDFKAFLTSPATNEINSEILNFGFGPNPTPSIYAGTVANADMLNVLDFNGDGKMEILVTKDGTSYILSIQRISAATGYSFASSVIYSTTEIVKNNRVFPGDFNGDRKTDLLVRKNDGSWKILYSNGVSFSSSNFTFNQWVTMTGSYSDDKVIVSDFNGDGKTDILHGFPVWVNGVSNSSKFSLYYSKGIASSFYYEQYDYNNVLAFGDFTTGDFNGDGRTDLLNRYYVNAPADFISFKSFGKERLLTKVTDGHNVTTSFDYKLLTDKSSFPYVYNRTVSLDNPANLNPFNYVQLPVHVVSSMTIPNGIGGNNTTSFFYEDAVVHRHAKGLLGFKKISTINVNAGINTVTENEINTQFAVPYMVKQSTILQSTLVPLSETHVTNSFVNLSSAGFDKRYFHKIDKTLEINHLSGTASETVNTYDSYGNIATIVSKTGTLSGSTVAPIETTTTTSIFSIHNTPFPAKPDNITVLTSRTGMPAFNSVTTFTYKTNGLLETKTDFYGLPKAVSTTYTYNAFGNPINATTSSAGLTSRIATNTYDIRGRFAISKQVSGNSLSQTETYTYDGKWGQPLTHTTSDCLTTSFEYDVFGQLKKTTLPQGFSINNSLVWDVSGNNVFYAFTDYPGGKPDIKIWSDKLGRETKTQTAGFNNQWLTQIITYDSRGRVSTKTNPYYSTETPLVTTTEYDDYNRPIVEYNDLSSAETFYTPLSGGRMQVTTESGGQSSSKISDATGKIIAAIDHGGQLDFTYDSRGNQVEVKHGTTVMMNSVYDEYGRQTSLTDKNAGTSTYVYDGYGLLIQQTDANNNTYNMTYDGLGRISSRSGPEGTTLFEYYSEATGCNNNNIKKITGFNGIIKEYTYDSYKRTATEKVTVEGIDYTTSFIYNMYNALTKTVYNSGIEENKTYDGNGGLLTVTAGNPGSLVTIFTASAVNGYGQYTGFTLGNGKSSQTTYNYGIPTRLYTNGVQDLNLIFDFTKGTLLTRRDDIKNITENFTFDNLNRLTTSTVNGVQQFTISYDGNSSNSMGNIISKTDAGNYVYRNDKVHAVAYITNPAGAQLPPSTIPTTLQQVSYTPFLKTASVIEGAYQTDFTYGPDYDRVKSVLKQNNAIIETKLYFGNYERKTSGGVTREIHYITGGNGICAVIVKENGLTNFNFVYTDHLGSPLTITDINGNIIAEQNFDAWGRHRDPQTWAYLPANSGGINLPSWLYRGYTGHEHLPQFALINMNGRMYDPAQGRMLSPDNYVASPFNTQGYNRYSYANNNPLCYVDPDGNIVWFIIAAAAIIGGTVNGIAYANNGRSFLDGFWRGALVGGAAALTGGAIAGALPGFGGAVLAGLGGGIVNGGLGAALNGGDVVQGIMFGAMTGVVGAGLGAYFGGGTGAFIGGAASGALGAELTGGDALTGAIMGGVSAFALYHGMNYYNYTRSTLKSVLTYRQFAQIGGDFQRSIARRKEFGGVAYTDGSMERVKAGDRASFSNTGRFHPGGRTVALHYHTHWAKPNVNFWTDANNNIVSRANAAFQSTSSNGPSPADQTGPAAVAIFPRTILIDRNFYYSYTATTITRQPAYYFTRFNAFSLFYPSY